MFISWRELTIWINTTLFECFLFLIAALISSIILAVKLEISPDISWRTVFAPLYLFDILSAYFCIIIFIRQYQNDPFRTALVRGFFSFKRILLLALFKLFLIFKLEGNLSFSYSEIFLPLTYLFFVFTWKSFRLCTCCLCCCLCFS